MNNFSSLNLITHEFQDLKDNPIASIGVCVGLPNPNNMYEWRCTMIGPSDTSFSGGLFYLKIRFPQNYPNSAPEVLFVTPIYHVNVNHINNPQCPLGHICLSTLNFWNSEYRMREVLTNIFALFYLGNPDSPFGIDRQKEMKENPALFEEKIKYFTQKYAAPNIGYQEYDHWDFSYPVQNQKYY